MLPSLPTNTPLGGGAIGRRPDARRGVSAATDRAGGKTAPAAVHAAAPPVAGAVPATRENCRPASP